MFFLSWLTAFSSRMGSVCLIMLMLSPVKMDWSIFRVVEWMAVIRTSAGILSPTEKNDDNQLGLGIGEGQGLWVGIGVRTRTRASR